MINASKTTLDGVLKIETDFFEDFRGEYAELYNGELYNKEIYKHNGVLINFVQDDISISTKDVLRGIHGDGETWKLISCLHGCFYFVVVNCDTESQNFGKWESFLLSDKNRTQILVPPKHGNAYLALSDTVIFHYKQSTYYNPKGQFTYIWNDPKLNIWWPIKNPIVSKRDSS